MCPSRASNRQRRVSGGPGTSVLCPAPSTPQSDSADLSALCKNWPRVAENLERDGRPAEAHVLSAPGPRVLVVESDAQTAATSRTGRPSVTAAASASGPGSGPRAASPGPEDRGLTGRRTHSRRSGRRSRRWTGRLPVGYPALGGSCGGVIHHCTGGSDTRRGRRNSMTQVRVVGSSQGHRLVGDGPVAVRATGSSIIWWRVASRRRRSGLRARALIRRRRSVPAACR